MNNNLIKQAKEYEREMKRKIIHEVEINFEQLALEIFDRLEWCDVELTEDQKGLLVEDINEIEEIIKDEIKQL